MSLTSDVKSVLQSNGFTDIPIYRSFMPDQNNVLALFQTGGRETSKASGINEPTFQIRLQHLDYDAGIKLLEDITTFLIELPETVLEPNRYLSFYAESDVMELGRDEQERFNFSLNFRCYVERNFFGYPFHFKMAQDAVIQAETSRLQEDIDKAKDLIAILPQDKQEVIELIARIDNLQNNVNLLNEAIHLVGVAEVSRLQADHDSAKTRVVLLSVDTDRQPLLDRLAMVQAYISESTRICIDFGVAEFATPGNWNNLVGYKLGSNLSNLMAMAGNATTIKLEVVKPFTETGIDGVDVDGIYYQNTIKDYFSTSQGVYGQLKITGLDPTKFYRISCFGSRDADGRVSKYIIDPTNGLLVNQSMVLDVSRNTSNTVAKTIKPSATGDIFVTTYNNVGWGYLNALEIQQV